MTLVVHSWKIHWYEFGLFSRNWCWIFLDYWWSSKALKCESVRSRALIVRFWRNLAIGKNGVKWRFKSESFFYPFLNYFEESMRDDGRKRELVKEFNEFKSGIVLLTGLKRWKFYRFSLLFLGIFVIRYEGMWGESKWIKYGTKRI